MGGKNNKEVRCRWCDSSEMQFVGSLPKWFSGKNPTANAGDTGDLGLIPGSGKSPGGRRGKSLQYSCLENPRDRGAWRAAVHEVGRSRMRVSTWGHTHQRAPSQRRLAALLSISLTGCWTRMNVWQEQWTNLIFHPLYHIFPACD